ncbi:MAG TPA: PglZ domain-containing protein [Pirellulales bacterium]|nr:PglZ domain-containing protein [Pirellulales bacterium]
MSVSGAVVRQLVDLLEEKRVVVWYDGERAFADLAARLHAPKCVVVNATGSVLAARREADHVFAALNASDGGELAGANLLVYVPRARAQSDDDRYHDPLEVFALAGASFGDKPSQTLASLARQAMPNHVVEIDRLFREGRPTLALLDDLKAGASYPVLDECLGTDAPLDVVAQVLCRKGTVEQIALAPGAGDELLRLVAEEFAYHPPAGAHRLEARLAPLGGYLLFSEFLFDLSQPPVPALAHLAVAPETCRERVFAVCDRMRRSDDTREGYLAMAERIEGEWRLKQHYQGVENLGQRDTFPFEERLYLQQVQAQATEARLSEARALVDQRRQSVWRNQGERAVLWKVAQRCCELLEAAASLGPRLLDPARPLAEHIAAYVDDVQGVWRLDRHQRLVEQGAASCADDDEIGPLVELARRRYGDLALQVQTRFLHAAARDGWPTPAITRQTQTFERYVAPALQLGRKVAYFLVDAMRYEMGRDLAAALDELGAAKVDVASGVLPATTPCGMAALLPGADSTWKLVEHAGTLVPSVADKLLPGSAERMNLLKQRFGDRFAEIRLGDVLSHKERRLRQDFGAADLVVVRTPEIDQLGEAASQYQARKHMTGVLGELVQATNRLEKLGFQRFVYAADHGHVLLHDLPPGDVVAPPPGRWLLTKRRSCLGTATGTASGVMVLKADKLGIVGPAADFAVATGFRVFVAGEGYFHEGLSLAECLVPVVCLDVTRRVPAGAERPELSIRYRSKSFTSRVVGVKLWFNSLLDETAAVRIEAYDGTGPKAKIVGEVADCDARDPVTGLVTVARGRETPVPIRLGDDFHGKMIEVRAYEAATGAVLDRLTLDNGLMI